MVPRVLTIAGRDRCGGAGVQADVKARTAVGGYAKPAATALTAQNTGGVRGVLEVAPEFVALQIDAVVEDIGVDAAKTGMLSGRAVIEVVAERVRRHGIRPLVVDPVMVAQSGDSLLADDAEGALRDLMLPLATVVTPNLPEAERLVGMGIETEEQMRAAARRIRDLGPEWVLMKGGHVAGDPVDLLFDGTGFVELRRPRVLTQNTHGTGCTYAAAIATGLAQGMTVPDAVAQARDAVQAGLVASLAIGHGHGPLDHRAMFRRPDEV